MDLATLILFPLLSGYIFSLLFPPSRYYAAREEGHKLYFRAAFYGFFLFTCSVLLICLLTNYIPSLFEVVWDYTLYLVSQSFGKYINNEKEIANLVLINGSCLLLALFFGGLSNLSKNLKYYIYNEVIKYDDIEIIITRAVENVMPISVSMKSRKAYVGFINNTIDPKEKRKDIRILPLLSGYREEKTNELIFTTNYYSIYESDDEGLRHLSPRDFEIAFPLSEVQSLNLFDIVAYNKFNENDEGNQLEFNF